MKARLETIGCRLNIGEVQSVARELARAGHRVVGPGETAEFCVVNTCAVTNIASKKSRQLIRQLKRANPGAAVVVTGCDAELSPHQMHELGVDLVVGNADKDRLVELATDRGLLREPEPELDHSVLFAEDPGGRTRAFVKVQDGCDNRCTFCIITVARGAGRSVPPQQVIDSIRALQGDGFNEVVVSGVHLGSYGHDLGNESGLYDLVAEILSQTEIPRLRLSSLEPWDLDAGFFDLFNDPRLLPHLHLPLQSGCDETLKRMARRTSQQEFSRLVEAARSAVPGLGLSTDVIVGFPGETDAEFEQSLAFVEAMAFSRLHVFRYSIRKGTPAAMMPQQVPADVARERSARMHELAAELEDRFNSSLVGLTLPVLWETAEDHGDFLRWSGLTPNYVRITTDLPPDSDLLNRVTDTEIAEVVPGGAIGRIRNSEF
jgi:threonylcarbamoyladenosine tRNA methylthiotransferase MtaB